MFFMGPLIKHTHLQQRKGELKEKKMGGLHQVLERLKEKLILMGGISDGQMWSLIAQTLILTYCIIYTQQPNDHPRHR